MCHQRCHSSFRLERKPLVVVSNAAFQVLLHRQPAYGASHGSHAYFHSAFNLPTNISHTLQVFHRMRFASNACASVLFLDAAGLDTPKTKPEMGNSTMIGIPWWLSMSCCQRCSSPTHLHASMWQSVTSLHKFCCPGVCSRVPILNKPQGLHTASTEKDAWPRLAFTEPSML